MQTLKEYEIIAKKLLISSFKRIASHIIKDNDKFGQVVTELAKADWQFDGRGSQEGYRKQRVSWIIKKIIDKKRPIVSLETVKDELICLPDKVSENIEFEDTYELLCNKIRDDNNLTSREQICSEQYFIQRLEMDDIASGLNIKRYAVKNYIRKAIIKLGVYDENIERLCNRNIRRKHSKRSTRKSRI